MRKEFKHRKRIICLIFTLIFVVGIAFVVMADGVNGPDALTPELVANPTSITFTSTPVGYAQPADKTITFTNVGGINTSMGSFIKHPLYHEKVAFNGRYA